MTLSPQIQDARFMRMALGLACRTLGRSWPNPSVGCVLSVSDDDQASSARVVGRGWTQPGGRPHAETQALEQAGSAARGATAYISLEPCAHHGQTLPCTDALIEAGIARAVVACRDPDNRVAGKGVDNLRRAGVEVVFGPEHENAEALNRGFFQRVGQGRPLITLKLAASLDGRITDAAGASQWITSEAARAWAHNLRARYDAVLIGSGTAVADDPSLTCRLPGMDEHSPVRVLFDSHLRVPPTANLFNQPLAAPLWLLIGDDVASDRLAPYRQAGADIICCPRRPDGFLELAAALQQLGERGLTRVLVEGGGGLAAALLDADLVDRMFWFQAPRLFGNEGLSAVAPFSGDSLDKPPRFRRVAAWDAGLDLCAVYVRREQDLHADLAYLI